MVEGEHARPLAPTADHQTTDEEEEEAPPSQPKQTRNKKCLRCCICVAILLLIEAIILIILIFTIFKIKNPIIKMNGVTIDQFNLINGATPRSNSNMSITADVSVKNPNYASFKYENTTTSLFYHGTVIGEARGPPGHARARRTKRMNITVDIMTDRIMSHPMLGGDFATGLITLTSFTNVGGRVKILNIVKRHVTVRMNCTVVVNITSQAIQEQECKRKVKL